MDEEKHNAISKQYTLKEKDMKVFLAQIRELTEEELSHQSTATHLIVLQVEHAKKKTYLTMAFNKDIDLSIKVVKELSHDACLQLSIVFMDKFDKAFIAKNATAIHESMRKMFDSFMEDRLSVST